MTTTDYEKARRLLARRDPIIAGLMKRHGPCGLADAQHDDQDPNDVVEPHRPSASLLRFTGDRGCAVFLTPILRGLRLLRAVRGSKQRTVVLLS